MKLYERWMTNWENRLAFRSTDRVVRPFDWGLEHIHDWPGAQRNPKNGHDPESYLRLQNQLIVDHSDEFFGYQPPQDFTLKPDDGFGLLTFTSPVKSPNPENDRVHGQWYASDKAKGRAVVVLPHWNAQLHQHGGLCRGFQKFGISALRLSLPYHDYRMPPELHRADYAVSANIGRTIHATRQAVIDIRAAFDWLIQQGYTRLGLVGTSLGSCYAFLASAHDPRIKVNIFNHCSTYVGDVVWTGLSTRHILEGIEPHIDRDRLREAWRGISPMSYMKKFGAQDKKSIFIYTSYDTTFLPSLSREILADVKRHGIPHKVVELPCGHYTMGESPFKFMTGYHIVNFALRNL